MTFTFGIITDGSNMERVARVIDSIKNMGMPHDLYEVIVVGGKQTFTNDNIRHVAFNEQTKRAWITKKKNMITHMARFNNVVYLHDYVSFQPDWYAGYVKYGDTFNVCINPIQNLNGSRYRDLTVFPLIRHANRVANKAINVDKLDDTISRMGEHECLIPYENYDEALGINAWMYISGAYWVAKRDVMLKHPLNERLVWGGGEDVEWSEGIKKNYRFSFNPHSTCVLLKQKDPVFTIMTPETVKRLQYHGLLR